MTTADIVMEHALDLARAGTGTDDAVLDLLGQAGDRRVAVVMARRHLVERQDEAPDQSAARAVELLDAVLDRMPE